MRGIGPIGAIHSDAGSFGWMRDWRLEGITQLTDEGNFSRCSARKPSQSGVVCEMIAESIPSTQINN